MIDVMFPTWNQITCDASNPKPMQLETKKSAIGDSSEKGVGSDASEPLEVIRSRVLAVMLPGPKVFLNLKGSGTYQHLG